MGPRWLFPMSFGVVLMLLFHRPQWAAGSDRSHFNLGVSNYNRLSFLSRLSLLSHILLTSTLRKIISSFVVGMKWKNMLKMPSLSEGLIFLIPFCSLWSHPGEFYWFLQSLSLQDCHSLYSLFDGVKQPLMLHSDIFLRRYWTENSAVERIIYY